MNMVLVVSMLLFISSVFGVFKINNKEVSVSATFFVVSATFLVIVFRNGNQLNDYESYVNLFNYYSNHSIDLFTEPTYYWISKCVHRFSDNVLYLFAIYGVLGLSYKIKVINKYTPFFWLSYVTYISYCFINQELIAIRVGVAIGIILYSIEYIANRKPVKFVIAVLIAILFHYSAITAFPLYFFCHFLNSKKKKIIILIFSFILVFVDLSMFGTLIPIVPIRNKVVGYLTGVSVMGKIKLLFRPIILYRYFIYVILLKRSALIESKDCFFEIKHNIMLYGLLMNNLFIFNETLSYRISMIFFSIEILLTPDLYFIFREKLLAKILIVFLAVFNFAYIVILSHIFH